MPLILIIFGIRKLTSVKNFKSQGFSIAEKYVLTTKLDGRKYGYGHLYKQTDNVVIEFVKLWK